MSTGQNHKCVNIRISGTKRLIMIAMVTDICTICRSSKPSCACLQSLTDFMGILLRVDRDVSSIQVTSQTIGPEKAEGCIDKLSLHVNEAIPRELIEERLRASNINFRVSTLRDRKWYLSAGDGLQFYLGHSEQQSIYKVITRPSAFKSWNAYHDRMETVIGEWIDEARISRLDLTVDYEIPFATMLQSLDVAHKRQRTEYQEASGVKTGLKIGHGTDKIIAYDKARECGSNEPKSRIELQLNGRSAPKTSMRDVSKPGRGADEAAGQGVASGDGEEGSYTHLLRQLNTLEYNNRNSYTQNENNNHLEIPFRLTCSTQRDAHSGLFAQTSIKGVLNGHRIRGKRLRDAAHRLSQSVNAWTIAGSNRDPLYDAVYISFICRSSNKFPIY